jgi:outer membrane protein TolC
MPWLNSWRKTLGAATLSTVLGTALVAAPPEGSLLPPLPGEPGQFPAQLKEKLGMPRQATPEKEEATGGVGHEVEAPASTGPVTLIDLRAALRFAGVENPEILMARQRVVQAMALRQLAAAQLLPSLNLGINYDAHSGALQQSSGNILNVDRSSLDVGAGANAVAAGTVNIPGLLYNLNVSQTVFDILISRQEVQRREYASEALQNQIFLQVAVAYTELLRGEGMRSIALQARDEAAEVARTVKAFVKAGTTAPADADRAMTELERRRNDLLEAEAEVQIASARLAELLGLDRQLRLHPVEERMVPMPLVPEPIPLRELLAIALLKRPELAQWQVAIRQALLVLHGARLLPFSPNLIIGLSGGDFGGGSDVATQTSNQARFGNFGERNDLDVVSYWTLQNLGIGNHLLVKIAETRVGSTELEQLVVLNQVRREVANALVRSEARLLQISSQEKAVRDGQQAFNGDLRRIRGGEGRPVALLESFRLLNQARVGYLGAIVQFNEAQIDLYVAIGKPPADILARPVPTQFQAPLEKLQGKKER